MKDNKVYDKEINIAIGWLMCNGMKDVADIICKAKAKEKYREIISENKPKEEERIVVSDFRYGRNPGEYYFSIPNEYIIHRWKFPKIKEAVESVVNDDKCLGEENGKYWYKLFTNTPLNEEKTSKINTAIKSIINDDTVVEDKKFDFFSELTAMEGVMYKEKYEQLFDWHKKTIASITERKYTQSEVDAIRKEVFNAARETNQIKESNLHNFRYPELSDYLSSLNLNTNDTGKGFGKCKYCGIEKTLATDDEQCYMNPKNFTPEQPTNEEEKHQYISFDKLGFTQKEKIGMGTSFVEKYRHDNTMTSYRIAHSLLYPTLTMNAYKPSALVDNKQEMPSIDVFRKHNEQVVEIEKSKMQKEKDWEILSYKNPRCFTDIKGADIIDAKGKDIDAYIAAIRQYPIHSVLRKSDKSVWEIGKYANAGFSKAKIESFKIEGDGVIRVYAKWVHNMLGSVLLSDLETTQYQQRL